MPFEPSVPTRANSAAPSRMIYGTPCGEQITQAAQPEVPANATATTPAANPASFDLAKINILGAVCSVFLFISLFLNFQSGGDRFIVHPEGWILIVVALAAIFFAFTKMDSFFMIASLVAVALVFLTLLLIAVGAHGTGSGALDAFAAAFGLDPRVPGTGVTFAMTCSLAMVASPIINRLFAKRK